MSARSFRSVFMVASCAGAALGCYLVSLRVASERAALEDVETKIVLAQRDIRLLQTEIGTRGRLAQLERWNVKVIALSAPTADQFLKDGFELARLTTPERQAPLDAPVILAAAPAPAEPDQPSQSAERTPRAGATEMLHHASLKTTPQRRAEVSLELRSAPVASKMAPTAPKPAAKGDNKAKVQAAPAKASAAKLDSVTKSTKAATAASSVPKSIKTAARQVPARTARDPLAPLPEKRTRVAAAKPKTSKDPIKQQ